MQISTLPAEVISLVHHIELNKAGWWDRTIQQLILAAIWITGGELSHQEIKEYYRKEFQINLDPTKVESQIGVLQTSNKLVLLPNEKYKISESALEEFEGALKESEQIESTAKAIFIEIVLKCCPSLKPEDIWEAANKQFILPMIRMMGAGTYEFISGSGVDWDNNLHSQKFLQEYPVEIRKGLRTAINAFLNSKDKAVRTYILNYLNSYFFLEAGNLREDTLNSIAKITDIKPSFNLFLDTNFLFSILNLHENPSNETVLFLKDLIGRLSESVSVKMYVLPPTVEEARKVLIYYQDFLKNLRITPNLADASLNVTLSGIVQKFFENSRIAGSSLNAELYFGPYIKDLSTIIRGNNIELFNEEYNQFKPDQDVFDDISDQIQFEKKRYGENAKTYEQLKHDMMIYHFVRGKRSPYLESPLDASYWVITVDFRYLGFDSYKRWRSSSNIQTCIHPTTLIQMLQFWIPRTPDFEEALLGSLRMPFLFQEFDANAEKTTIRILEALGRYENIGDLSKETITNVLFKEALRQRISTEQNIDTQIQLVKEALIEEHEKTVKMLQEKERETEVLKEEIAHKRMEIKTVGESIGIHKEKLNEAEHQLIAERNKREILERSFLELEQNFRDHKEREDRKKEINGFLKRCILSVAPIAIAEILLYYLLDKFTPLKMWERFLICLFSSLIIWVYLTDRLGLKKEWVKSWRPFSFFEKFKRIFFWILGPLFLGVLVNALWDLIKISHPHFLK